MNPDIHPFILLLGSIFTGNILLSNFLGMCSFIAISKDFKASNGLGIAVTLVLVITSLISWVIFYYVLEPLGLFYLRFIVFIIVIAAVVQILEMVIDRISPSLYITLGIFLPLITVNCAIFGAILFMQIRTYSFVQTLFFSVGAGIGWWLAIILLAAIRELKTEKAPVPEGLKGIGITLITIGIMAMGFMGFAGMLPVQ